MNPLGHWGIVLFAFGFVVAGLVARDRIRAAQVVTVLALGVGVVPDIDLYIATLVHRGVTHTLPTALLAGVVLGTVAWLVEPFALVDRREETFYGVLTGTLGVLCHIAGDVITPMGIKVLYPVSDAAYTFDLVSAHNQTANAAMLVVGTLTYLTVVGYAHASTSAPARSAWFNPSTVGVEADTDTEL